MKCFPLVCLLAVAGSATAHDMRHHAAHVHGQATADLAIDQNLLEIALTAPGIGILDFERPPATPAERTALQRAKVVLKSGQWIELPAAASCRLEQGTAQSEGFDPAPAAAAGGHTHAGFSASLRYRCQAPKALESLRVTLSTQFPATHEVIVNIATATGQGRQVLTEGQQSVDLTQ
jgi:hypothetical protein